MVGKTLLVSRAGLFGVRQREWRTDEIDRIVCGPSGVEVNDVPVMQLQIHRKTGRKYGLLSQLNDEELHWIASVLSDVLQLSQSSQTSQRDDGI